MWNSKLHKNNKFLSNLESITELTKKMESTICSLKLLLSRFIKCSNDFEEIFSETSDKIIIEFEVGIKNNCFKESEKKGDFLPKNGKSN